MQTILSLDVVSTIHEISYQSPLLGWKSKLSPDTAFFDLDNLSDGLVLTYAIDLLAQAEKAVVLVNVKSAEASIGKILPLFEKCLAHPYLLLISIGFPHALVSRYAKLLPSERHLQSTDLSAARPLIISFLQQ